MNILKSMFTPMPSLNASDAQARLKGANPLYVLDVREYDEYTSGHIPQAKAIPLGQLTERMSELPKDREILVVCRSGARSGMATRQLLAAGYHAINLDGGMISWQRQNLPIKKGK